MEIGDVLYRVHYYHDVDFETSYSVKLKIKEYPIIKLTPKGCWIRLNQTDKKFVLLSARKKYANEAIKEAYESFILRKQRHNDILLTTIENNKDAISLAKEKLEEINNG